MFSLILCNSVLECVMDLGCSYVRLRLKISEVWVAFEVSIDFPGI